MIRRRFDIPGYGPLNVAVADTPWLRMRGLLGRPTLGGDEAMWIGGCNLVHTYGMRYAIDVVFADRHRRILKVVTALRPRRIAGAWGAAQVLELPAHGAGRFGFVPGTYLPTV